MTTRGFRRHPAPAALAMAGLLLSQTALPAAASGRATTPAPHTAARTAPSPADGGWPRTYTTPSGARLVLYQPQVASWPEQKHITLYAAVSYLAPGATAPALGTIKVESETKVSVSDRLVAFSELAITQSNFPTLPREEMRTVVGEIGASVPRAERVIGLDRVLAGMDTSDVSPHNVAGVRADPPAVFFSTKPAVLVNLDGDPIWSPIPTNDLRFAVNTNWDLFQSGTTGSLYLRVNDSWMRAASLNGPWTPEHALPASFGKLPDDGNWKDVKAALSAPAKADAPAVTVFVSTKPAELILVKGAPLYTPVMGTRLQWLGNTDSDVFRLGADGAVYYLVSGRWFSAPGFSGPWTFTTPNLPADFKNIPLEHPRSRVLAAVPGTTQALEAVLLAQVPQTASVSRRDVQPPDVRYTGEPRFDPIEKTSLARAVNTDKDVIRVGDFYFLCFQGVWFVASTASGPWTLADSIPQEIYQIPISSPAYNVTAVTVESATSDEVVYAAAAAYTGMMVAWGCAVWGTGWYYPPYVGWGGYYPAYYPRYPSYGYGAWYNPWNGAYTRAGAVYGPYGGAGYAARYNPGTGTYARGAAAWGPGGARGAAQAWNPRTGMSAQTRQGANVYGSWGSTAVQRGDSWAQSAHVSNRVTDTTTRATRGSEGGAAVSRRGAEGGGAVAKSGGGDIYAGRDGNVYRNQGGTWQKYDNGGWSNVDRGNQAVGTSGQRGAEARQGVAESGLNAGTRDQLNRDRASRADGKQRTRDLGAAGRGGARSGGTYRPGGGGFSRGGGGRMGGGGGRRR